MKEISLRPFVPQRELVVLRELFTGATPEEALPEHPVFRSGEECERWLLGQLSGAYYDVMLAEEQGKSTPMAAGVLFACEERIYDGHCRVAVVFRSGAVRSACLKDYLCHLFREYPLRKVFLETVEGNRPLLEAARTVGFREEARFTESRYLNGRYQDTIVLGLKRDEVMKE